MSPSREAAPTPPEAFGLPKAPANALEEGLQLTGYLKSSLQVVRRAFLQVGKLLILVREKTLYAAMGHPDLESYAAERLRLGRSSLYNYLHIFEWVKANHPEWIDAAPGVFVPDLSDVVDLIHFDGELKRKDLPAATKRELKKLQTKALKGELKRSDTAAFRQRGRSPSGEVQAFLASLRQLRERGARLTEIPPEAIARLDDAIEIVSHVQTLTGLDASGKR